MIDDRGYDSLPSTRTFRLLKITSCREGGSQGETQLECSLDIFALDDTCPKYVALSYTWGPAFDDPVTEEQYGPDHDRAISISHDGKPPCEQQIGRNLFEALVQVHKTKWQSHIWADAVCINQANLDERVSQIQLMGNIYSQPEFVIAWLGPEPAWIDDILWWYGPFLEYLEPYYVNHQANGPNIEISMPQAWATAGSDGDWIMIVHGSRMIVSPNRVLALRDWFLRTRYWSRAWIQQEITLPKEVVFLIGPHDLTAVIDSQRPFDRHTALWFWMNKNQSTIQYLLCSHTNASRPMKMPGPPLTYTVAPARSEMALRGAPANEFRRKRVERYGVTSDESDGLAMLEQALARSSHLSATDPRDKIYGLLGIVNYLLPHSVGLIPVTYELTIRELLKVVTIRLLTGLPFMTCFALRTPSCFPKLDGLPSWVIDPTPQARALIPGGFSARRRIPYNACPTRNQENAVIEFDGNALQLYGHCCGEITSLFKTFNESTDAPDFDHDLQNMAFRGCSAVIDLLKLAKDIGPLYRWVDSQPICEAFVQIMALSNAAEEVYDSHVDPKIFWIVVKHTMARLVGDCKREDAKVATTARGYLNDCTSIVMELARSGFSILESLLKYTRRLMIEDLELAAFDSPETIMAEVAADCAFVQSVSIPNNAVFRTRDDFLGLATDDTRPGDQLWILCRAKVPQVLRPLSDGTFITLGEAYVHGGVDGELIEKGIAGPLRKISIV